MTRKKQANNQNGAVLNQDFPIRSRSVFAWDTDEISHKISPPALFQTNGTHMGYHQKYPFCGIV